MIYLAVAAGLGVAMAEWVWLGALFRNTPFISIPLSQVERVYFDANRLSERLLFQGC